MCHKIKTIIQNFGKTAIIVVATIFIASAANAQSKQTDIVGVWEGRYGNSGKVTLTINDDMKGVFDFVNGSAGSYSVLAVYSNGRYNIVGKEWINRPSGFVFADLNGGVIKNGIFNGTDFQLKRVATAQQLRDQQAEQEKQLQIQQVEQEKQLQAQKAKEEKELLLIFIGLGAFVILEIVIARHFIRKAKERKKKYQPIFAEVFKERGFSATDIIWTNCQYKITDYVSVNNIIIGVKDETLSFFGGGSAMVLFQTKNRKVAFSVELFLPWKKLLKENYDLLISDGKTAKRLFPKNGQSNFKHLFDISIYDIETVEGKRRGKDVELTIECSDKLIKLLPRCTNMEMKIDIANTMIGAFEKIVTSGTISEMRISQTNEDICDAVKRDGKMTAKRQLKIVGAVVGTAVVIGSVAAGSGIRNWSKDR